MNEPMDCQKRLDAHVEDIARTRPEIRNLTFEIVDERVGDPNAVAVLAIGEGTCVVQLLDPHVGLMSDDDLRILLTTECLHVAEHARCISKAYAEMGRPLNASQAGRTLDELAEDLISGRSGMRDPGTLPEIDPRISLGTLLARKSLVACGPYRNERFDRRDENDAWNRSNSRRRGAKGSRTGSGRNR